MKYLLDTHGFLWLTSGDPRLSATARALLKDPDAEIFLSVASLWEIAVKVNIGKLTLDDDFKPFVTNQMIAYRIDRLDVTIEHLSTLIALPLHHRDPFDRLIIAQAVAENLPIISVDVKFDAYPVKRLW